MLYIVLQSSLTIPGIVSILMFWGYLEIGVGIAAACLPMLRPLFEDWSLESVIRSVRSTISLRSFGNSSNFHHIAKEGTGRSESETAIRGVPEQEKSQHELVSIDVEAYAMGRVNG